MFEPDKKEREIFNKAIEIETPEERAAYIKTACGDDNNLIERITALLSAHYEADFLPTHPGNEEITLSKSPLSENPGTVIGCYKLLEKIGEGGMAVVYMAEQEKPIHRKVALKIIKPGMDTKQVIARFEAERQVLAMMDHPNIAKVFDAGATETGRPYFVMELVTGVSITEYCDKNNLSTKERLALFIKVCNAIQHAHQKGIIHRDIKPSNIMVTQLEGKPIPKVIDFGIAKAINQKLTEKTIFTRYAHLIGTPAYMSPEQAELSDMDIDTRSDIYSLGVLLYELLTGTTPFSEEQLREAGYIEMQRIIREKEPAKPSTKLSTLGQTLTDIAKHHGCKPDILTKSIRGDLDWIVMKALEKGRDRRYETVSALTMDVERHLKDEPILARAPSTIYSLRKFLRRHKSSAAAILLTSVFAVTLLTMFLVWKYNRLLEEKLYLMDRNSINRAINSLLYDDFNAALADIEPLLGSKYVGSEARSLRDKIMTMIRERVSDYTEKIKVNPGDAENYLLRAQLYYCLHEKDKMIADMDEYIAILNPLGGSNQHNSELRQFLSGFWQGTPTVITTDLVTAPSVSTDGLSMYVDSRILSVYGGWDLFVYTRETIHEDWSEPVNLGPTINSSYLDGNPDISADGLTLYFTSIRPEGYGDRDLWFSTRATKNDPWSEPENLGSTINGPYQDAHSSVTSDGLILFFCSDRPNGFGDRDIYFSTRASENDDWSEPENLGSIVNSSFRDSGPDISSDGLTLFFDSERPGGYGLQDIWVTTRATTEDDWGVPMNIGSIVNNSSKNYTPCISADGSIFYWWSNIGSLRQISVATSSEVFQEDSHSELDQKTQ